MAALKFKTWHQAGLALLTALCVQGAFAQGNAAPAPAPAAAAAPAPMPAAAPAPAAAAAVDAPKKRRYAARRSSAGCTKLDDPWDNLCTIQQKAQVACADLPAGRGKAIRNKRGSVAPVVGNPRKECVDAYMSNV